jgi:CheY-like chemotaxis protein
MSLINLKKRLQADNDSQDRKLIKSVLDIINPPSNQPSQREAGTGEQLNKDNLAKENRKIVLHIDDDPEDRELVHETIHRVDPSFIVNEAGDGKSGIEFLKKAKSFGDLPCLIILDLNMPGMNGFEIYNEIKKDEVLKNIPTVIFTTAAFFKGDQRKGNEDLPVFIKPVKIKEFVASIQKILTHCKD